MAREPESWIWRQAFQLFVQAGRLERDFFPLRSECRRGPLWEPPYDMFETEGQLWVLVAMPGVHPDRAEVALEGRTLWVRGERCLPIDLKGALVHRLEIPWGRLERRIDLPAAGFRLATRELSLGCLILSLERS
jgi:HSP20 family molecular chaperone IbpA